MRKAWYKRGLLYVLPLLVFIVAACTAVNDTDSDGNSGPSVTLSASSTTVEVEGTVNITATVVPTSEADNFEWSSSSTNIGTISDGLFTGVAEGVVTINGVITSNATISDNILMTVVKKSPTSIALDISSKDIKVGETCDLTETITPGTANDSITWESSSTSVATVSSSGVVTGVARGTATIKAMAKYNNTVYASFTAKVENTDNIATFSLAETTKTLVVGDTFSLDLTELPATVNITKEYTTSDGSIATVSNAGLVTAIKAGTATITVQSKYNTNVKATCVLTIDAALQPTSIALDLSEKDIKVGGTCQLTETIAPQDASDAITWESSSTSVATVSSSGLVTGVARGTTTIKAMATDKTSIYASFTAKVENTDNVATFALNESSKTLGVDATLQLELTVLPSTVNITTEYTTSDGDIATVSSAGLITAIGVGTATITAQSKYDTDTKATCVVTVVSSIQPTSLSLSGGTTTLNSKTVQLTSTISPENATDKSVTWEVSSGSTVGNVSSSGLVTALDSDKQGMVYVRATSAVNNMAMDETSITFTKQATGVAIATSDSAVVPDTKTYTIRSESYQANSDYTGDTPFPSSPFSAVLAPTGLQYSGTTTFTSSDDDIVEFTADQYSNPIMTAKTNGVVNVTATNTFHNVSKTVALTLYKAPTSVSISPSATQYVTPNGQTIDYGFTVAPDGSKQAVTWKLQNTLGGFVTSDTYFEIDSDGLLTVIDGSTSSLPNGITRYVFAFSEAIDDVASTGCKVKLGIAPTTLSLFKDGGSVASSTTMSTGATLGWTSYADTSDKTKSAIWTISDTSVLKFCNSSGTVTYDYAQTTFDTASVYIKAVGTTGESATVSIESPWSGVGDTCTVTLQ
jgi:uncharacterized protein YjdB